MSEDVRASKDALEKPKHKKEHINENSNRYFVQNLKKIVSLSQNLRSKFYSAWIWSSRYDKQVKKPTIESIICHPGY